jgi:hypothetical protein
MTTLIRDVIANPVAALEVLLRLAANVGFQFRGQFEYPTSVCFGN